jgi:hypothetical protein
MCCDVRNPNGYQATRKNRGKIGKIGEVWNERVRERMRSFVACVYVGTCEASKHHLLHAFDVFFTPTMQIPYKDIFSGFGLVPLFYIK